jgi:hypothetical protein
MRFLDKGADRWQVRDRRILSFESAERAGMVQTCQGFALSAPQRRALQSGTFNYLRHTLETRV